MDIPVAIFLILLSVLFVFAIFYTLHNSVAALVKRREILRDQMFERIAKQYNLTYEKKLSEQPSGILGLNSKYGVFRQIEGVLSNREVKIEDTNDSMLGLSESSFWKNSEDDWTRTKLYIDGGEICLYEKPTSLIGKLLYTKNKNLLWRLDEHKIVAFLDNVKANIDPSDFKKSF